jgi:hypothetical protein
MLKSTEKEFRRLYKEGATVEENYQKLFKKYYRNKLDWEENLMSTLLLTFVPGISNSQIDKARQKSAEERQDLSILERKYLNSLEAFNGFASRYNSYA